MSKITLKGYGAKLTPTNGGEPFTVNILSSHIPRIGETVVHKGVTTTCMMWNTLFIRMAG